MADDDAEDYHVDKPLGKGRQYFVSGHVKDIQDQADPMFFFLKAKVMASYSVKTEYNTFITLARGNGKVIDSTCECKASAMGRCSHVAALLFAVEDYMLQFGNKPGSCTSKLCKWNLGRKKEKYPKPVHVSQYSKKTIPDRLITFDPRIKKFEDNFEKQFIASLPQNTMFCTVLEITYSDYELSPERRQVLQDLTQIFIENVASLAEDHVWEFPDTISQYASEQWRTLRGLHITASNAKEFANVQTGHFNLLNRTLWGHSAVSTAAMEYGQKHENHAFDAYIQTVPGNLTVHKCGFFVNKKYPGLGCSPDGIIVEGSKRVGVLEVKCPSVLKNLKPTDIKELTKQQQNAFCCALEETTKELVLKQNHAYYWQVQMQMAICEVMWCDFVVWSEKGICIQKVLFDEHFWTLAEGKLIDAYKSFFVPEYFEMRVPRKLPSFTGICL